MTARSHEMRGSPLRVAIAGIWVVLASCGDDAAVTIGMDGATGEGGRPSAAGSGILTFDADMLRGDAGSATPAPDGGSRFDLGSPPGRDSGAGPGPGCSYDPGPAPGDCVLHIPRGRFGPLIDDCFPRCSSATAAAYRACTTQTCRDEAVDGDSTPALEYYIGDLPVRPPLDCAACVSYQEVHCFSLVCPTEVEDYAEHCIARADEAGCDLALIRLDTCLAILTEDQRMVVRACFVSHEGPEACFPCE